MKKFEAFNGFKEIDALKVEEEIIEIFKYSLVHLKYNQILDILNRHKEFEDSYSLNIVKPILDKLVAENVLEWSGFSYMMNPIYKETLSKKIASTDKKIGVFEHIQTFEAFQNETDKEKADKAFKKKVARLKQEIIKHYQDIYNGNKSEEAKRFREMGFSLTHTNVFNDPIDYGEENYFKGFDYLEKFIKELLKKGILIQTDKEKNIRKGTFQINPTYARVSPSLLLASRKLAERTAKIGLLDDDND